MTTDEIPTEALQAAVEAAAKAWYATYQHDPATDPDGRYPLRQAILAAAPHLIAEGRRQATVEIAEQLRARGEPTHRDHRRCAVCETPAEYAERKLRASRERQAGLDYGRIEAVRARIAEGKVDR